MIRAANEVMAANGGSCIREWRCGLGGGPHEVRICGSNRAAIRGNAIPSLCRNRIVSVLLCGGFPLKSQKRNLRTFGDLGIATAHIATRCWQSGRMH
jgi:hypothetical protein